MEAGPNPQFAKAALPAIEDGGFSSSLLPRQKNLRVHVVIFFFFFYYWMSIFLSS
jgi:hypothetical protein